MGGYETHPDFATRDHLKPRCEEIIKHPGQGAENVVLACYDCNQTKADMSVDEFFDYLEMCDRAKVAMEAAE